MRTASKFANSRMIPALFMLMSAGVLGVAPIQAYSADLVVSEVAMDLTSELNRLSLDPATVNTKGLMITANSQSHWLTGSPQQVNNAYYTLQVTAGHVSNVNHGLKVSYNALRTQPVEVAACNGDNVNCVAIEVQPNGGGRSVFSLDGNSYAFTALGPPCKTGIACEFYLSSWHLMNMIREMNGSMPMGFPKAAAVLDAPAQILIADLERKRIWMTIAKASLPLSGTSNIVQSTSYNGAGELTIQFAGSALLLDFVRDRAVLATGEELLTADGALVGIGVSGFTPVLTVPRSGDQAATLIALNGQAVVWSTHYLAGISPFQAGQLALRQSPYPLHSASMVDNQLIALSSQGQNLRRLTMQGGSLAVSDQLSVGASSEGGSYQLIGADIWLLDTDRADLIDRNTGQAAPTSISSLPVTAITDGQAVLKRQIGTNCRFAHVIQNSTSAAAFKDSGLVMSCAARVGISVSGSTLSMWGQSGSIVQAGYITQ